MFDNLKMARSSLKSGRLVGYFKNPYFRDANDMKKSEEVKERILSESIKLFLSKGFSGATTNELVRLSGVSKGALYWHFKDKDDILGNIIEKYDSEFNKLLIQEMDDCKDSFPDKFKKFYKVSSELARDNRDLLLAFTSVLIEFAGAGNDIEKKMKDVNNQYMLIIQKLIEDGIQEGTVRKEIHPVIYSRIVAAALMGSLILHYLNFSSYKKDPALNRQHGLIIRNEMMNMLLSKKTESLPD